MLLQVETTPGGGTFATIGGSTSHTLPINNEAVDVSDKDSSNGESF
jgi:predicted secreted protein